MVELYTEEVKEELPELDELEPSSPGPPPPAFLVPDFFLRLPDFFFFELF